MKFKSLDAKMRVFETAHDHCVLPGMHMVARLDGRHFTRLTREKFKFDAPFDVRFRDMMTSTVEHLMRCGFQVLYGYTESDEISLLFHRDETAFNRKLRKYDSILAGEASAKFSLLLGDAVSFDCRVCQFPTVDLVCDYFRWRNEDAHRNAMSGHCYWMLRGQGKSPKEAASRLRGMPFEDKETLLRQQGIDFDQVPPWQKRGIGLYWETYEKPSRNPKTGEVVVAVRKRLKTDFELPLHEDYTAFLKRLISATDLERNSNRRDTGARRGAPPRQG